MTRISSSKSALQETTFPNAFKIHPVGVRATIGTKPVKRLNLRKPAKEKVKLTKLDPVKQKQVLRLGLLGLSLRCLWRKPCLLESWEKPSYAVTYFCMGIFETFAGLTGYYVEGVIPRLGFYHVMFDSWLEKMLKIKRDPELSQRIVDPRFEIAALEAIEESKNKLKRENLGNDPDRRYS